MRQVLKGPRILPGSDGRNRDQSVRSVPRRVRFLRFFQLPPPQVCTVVTSTKTPAPPLFPSVFFSAAPDLGAVFPDRDMSFVSLGFEAFPSQGRGTVGPSLARMFSRYLSCIKTRGSVSSPCFHLSSPQRRETFKSHLSFFYINLEGPAGRPTLSSRPFYHLPWASSS